MGAAMHEEVSLDNPWSEMDCVIMSIREDSMLLAGDGIHATEVVWALFCLLVTLLLGSDKFGTMELEGNLGLLAVQCSLLTEVWLRSWVSEHEISQGNLTIFMGISVIRIPWQTELTDHFYGTIGSSNSLTDRIDRPFYGTIGSSNSLTDRIDRPFLWDYRFFEFLDRESAMAFRDPGMNLRWNMM